jgi:histidinol-phosphate/aromatic aminotransferase/cobyric acid decarboxylase-like protein
MAIAALEDKERIITQVIAETRCSRDYLIEEFKKLGYRIRNISEASMMVVEVPNTIKVTDIDEHLKDQGVYVRAGHYTSKLHGDQYFRVSFSQPLWKSMKFMDAFKETHRVLNGR